MKKVMKRYNNGITNVMVEVYDDGETYHPIEDEKMILPGPIGYASYIKIVDDLNDMRFSDDEDIHPLHIDPVVMTDDEFTDYEHETFVKENNEKNDDDSKFLLSL